jgi:hypothetical protein
MIASAIASAFSSSAKWLRPAIRSGWAVAIRIPIGPPMSCSYRMSGPGALGDQPVDDRGHVMEGWAQDGRGWRFAEPHAAGSRAAMIWQLPVGVRHERSKVAGGYAPDKPVPSASLRTATPRIY